MADRARRGRPPTRSYAAHEPRPLSVRIPPQWKDWLDEKAASKGRSLWREIEEHLKRSTDPEQALFEELLIAPRHVLGKALVTNLGLHGGEVAIAFVVTVTIVEQLCRESVSSERGKSWSTDRWLDDPRCWAAFTDAVAHLYGDESFPDPGRRPMPGEWDRIGPWAAATARARLQHGLPREFWPPDRR
jgi:hypothetical protein